MLYMMRVLGNKKYTYIFVVLSPVQSNATALRKYIIFT